MSGKKDLYRWDDAAFNDAFDRTVVNIHLRKQESGSKTFVVCGCEPKVGATTIAINLAIAMATSGWKTIMIDADMRKDQDYKRLSEDHNNLDSYLTNRMGLEEIICATNHDNLSYISGGTPSLSTIQLLCMPRMSELIGNLKEEFDYVIIDAAAPRAAVDACILAAQSDGVILVARWANTTTEMIRSTRDELKVSGAPILGVIINRMDKESYIHNNNNYTYFTGKEYTFHTILPGNKTSGSRNAGKKTGGTGK